MFNVTLEYAIRQILIDGRNRYVTGELYSDNIVENSGNIIVLSEIISSAKEVVINLDGIIKDVDINVMVYVDTTNRTK